MSTPTPHEPEDLVAEAEVSQRSGISIVWLVPLVALAIGGWLAYKAFSERGPTITIDFKDAAGVIADKTLVRYRDVQIGKVTAVRVSEDLDEVTLTAELDKKATRILGKNARFWIAQPELSITGVRGLQTLLSGVYIGVDPDTEGETQRKFIGLEKQPFIIGDREGRYFVLTSPNRGSLNRGAPVLFYGFPVGQITDFDLIEDHTEVDVRIFIDGPHDKRITEHTRFWDVSGIDVEMSADGINVKTKSMAAILIGGITFGDPPGSKAAEPAAERTRFKLYPSRHEAFKPKYTRRRYLVHFHESVRGLNVGAPVEFRGAKMGEVVDIRAQFHTKELAFRIPVYVDIEPERFEIFGKIATDKIKRVSNFQTLIGRGLRAQLRTGSLLTGQKLIEIDMHPEAEAVEVTYEDGLLVIPTVPTVLDTVTEKVTDILAKIDRLPIEAIGEDLRGTLSRVRHLVEEAEIQAAIDALSSTLSEAKVLVGRLNDDVVPPLTTPLQQTSRFSNDLNTELTPQLSDVLRELQGAARAIRILSDYLEQHPDALIKGKK